MKISTDMIHACKLVRAILKANPDTRIVVTPVNTCDWADPKGLPIPGLYNTCLGARDGRLIISRGDEPPAHVLPDEGGPPALRRVLIEA